MRSDDMLTGPGTGAVLIELGTERGRPDDDALTGRPSWPGWLPPLLVALFVLGSAAASGAPPPPPLSVLFSVPGRSSDPYVLTGDGTMLVHAPFAGTLSGYDLTTGETKWQSPATVPPYRVRTGSGLVLLRTQYTSRGDLGTLAVSAATGKVRWRIGGSVLTVPGSPTLLGVSEVRSSAGEGRRIEGPVTGLDPATGLARWALPVTSTAVLLGIPAAAPAPGVVAADSAGAGASAPMPRMLLVHDDGTAVLHDLDTGRQLATVRLPPADYAPGDPGVIGGMLMLRHPTGVGSQVSAYDMTTLQLRWTRSVDAAYDMTGCGGLVCLIGPSGVQSLDPADGAQRWQRPGWRGVEQRGGLLLAYGQLSDSNDLVGVVEPETGRIAVPLSSWRPVAGEGGGDHLLVSRSEGPEGRTMVAVVHPGAARPRPLGELPAGAGDCRAAPERLVCRSPDGTLVVWEYSWR